MFKIDDWYRFYAPETKDPCRDLSGYDFYIKEINKENVIFIYFPDINTEIAIDEKNLLKRCRKIYPHQFEPLDDIIISMSAIITQLREQKLAAEREKALLEQEYKSRIDKADKILLQNKWLKRYNKIIHKNKLRLLRRLKKYEI